MDMSIPQSVMRLHGSRVELPIPSAATPPKPVHRRQSGKVEFMFSEQLSATHDPQLQAMWLRWNPSPRPNFNLALLEDLGRYCGFIARAGAGQEGYGLDSDAGPLPIDFAVLSSGIKGVFNLGGDLNLFTRMIEAQDREGLLNYGHACISVLYRNYIGHGLPITTISLIQGECLGGGFEAALSSDVLIAEESARFGFPEILFNLFPGMGAYSFLERKIGARKTEELISSGKIYSADDMLQMGLVHTVVADGEGEAAVGNYIRARRHKRSGIAGLAAARRAVERLEYDELSRIVEIWVDTALRLSGRDLKLMQRLVSRQNNMHASRKLH